MRTKTDLWPRSSTGVWTSLPRGSDHTYLRGYWLMSQSVRFQRGRQGPFLHLSGSRHTCLSTYCAHNMFSMGNTELMTSSWLLPSTLLSSSNISFLDMYMHTCMCTYMSIHDLCLGWWKVGGVGRQVITCLQKRQ